MRIVSFGYRDAAPALREGLAVLDCRSMRNPHSVARLRRLDGRDPRVQAYVAADPCCANLLEAAAMAARAGKDVAYGCHGGRHRSVAMAMLLQAKLAAVGVCATIEHRCL